MNFDEFIERFNGQIEVLSDALDASDLPQDEKELIYEDLFQKLALRMRGQGSKIGFYVLTQHLVGLGEEPPEEKGFHKSWTPIYKAPVFHMRKVTFVNGQNGRTFTYETYYTMSNTPYEYRGSLYSRTEAEAMEKMTKQMKEFGGRILL